MKLPELIEIETSRSIIDRFGGYNHNLMISENEFYDTKDMCSDQFPVLSSRKKRRAFYETSETGSDILSKGDRLYFADGENLCYFEKDLSEKHVCELPTGVKLSEISKLFSFSAYIIIMPEKIWYNTADKTTGKIEVDYTLPHADFLVFEPSTIDGVGFSYPISDTPPQSPKNGDYWMDSSSQPRSLKKYSETTGMWVASPTNYIKITGFSKDLLDLFEEGDCICFKGTDDFFGLGYTEEEYQFFKEVNEIFGNYIILRKKGTDTEDKAYFLVNGLLSQKGCLTSGEEDVPTMPCLHVAFALSIERKMPDFDFMFESGNRMWGCKYEKTAEEYHGYIDPFFEYKSVNEIYASKLGDFKNWHCFEGISTDSYVASVGSDRGWTGGIDYMGSPLFFKEDCMYRVYGNYPANFQIQHTSCEGVQKGSHKSLTIIKSKLYYKSPKGVCVFDGSYPISISDALGDVFYSNAVGGGYKSKYYLSMTCDGQETWFTYDIPLGIWHKEQGEPTAVFCEHQNDLYYLSNGKIYVANGITPYFSSLEEGPLDWFIESGIIGASSPDKKYLSRMNVKMSMDIGTRVSMYIQYDSNGMWEHVFTVTGKSLKTYTVPVRAKRCDHLRYKLVGNGGVKIFSITKTLEEGSDV